MRQVTASTPFGPIQQDAYCVDGRMYRHPDADYGGDGKFPPFVIFDIEAQDNLPGHYRTREEAERVMGLLK